MSSNIEPTVHPNKPSLREIRDRRYECAIEDARSIGGARQADLNKRAQIARRRAHFEKPEPVMPTISSALIDAERSRRLSRRLQQRLSGVASEVELQEGEQLPVDVSPYLSRRQDRERIRRSLMESSGDNPDLPPAS